MREHIDLVEATTRPAKLETTPLPYGMKDLDPVMSKETLEYHFEHLAKGYAKRYNAGEGDTSYYTLRDNTNGRVYRITLMIGASYNNNFISIERLL